MFLEMFLEIVTRNRTWVDKKTIFSIIALGWKRERRRAAGTFFEFEKELLKTGSKGAYRELCQRGRAAYAGYSDLDATLCLKFFGCKRF